jgi:hypothetical protein
MNENHVSPLPFYLGALEEDELDAAQAHLLACRTCLSEYLSAKRRVDSAAAFDERPSPAARHRLRTEVSHRLRPAFYRPRVWAAVAAIAALLFFFVWLRNRPPDTATEARETLVDTSTDMPTSQAF